MNEQTNERTNERTNARESWRRTTTGKGRDGVATKEGIRHLLGAIINIVIDKYSFFLLGKVNLGAKSNRRGVWIPH
jgi:hypothetical protein